MYRLRQYIEYSSNFSQEEKQKMYEELGHHRIGKLVGLIIILTTWSIIAFFIESTLIGGGLVFSIIKGIDWRYFIPEIIIFIN